MQAGTAVASFRTSRFIAGPVFDGILFLACPLLCLLLGFLLSGLDPVTNEVFFLDQPGTVTSIVLRTIIHSHLVIVFFRSHGNREVFWRHPIRFTVVPVLLLVSTLASLEWLAIVILIAAYWDAYHSSMQTFGIGRIYDLRAGADVHKGRQLDIWLNHFIYLGPFMAGPLWVVTAQLFDIAHEIGFYALDPVKTALIAVQPILFWIIVCAAPPFVVVYVLHVVKRARAGERLSWQKYALFLSTAICCVWAWGFNPFGQALLIVNTFHAVQYFAIVYWTEKENLGRLMGTSALPGGKTLTAIALVIAGVAYGFWFSGVGDYWAASGWLKRCVLALTNVVAILHFWYDGFIWSVRKREV